MKKKQTLLIRFDVNDVLGEDHHAAKSKFNNPSVCRGKMLGKSAGLFWLCWSFSPDSSLILSLTNQLFLPVCTFGAEREEGI